MSSKSNNEELAANRRIDNFEKCKGKYVQIYVSRGTNVRGIIHSVDRKYKRVYVMVDHHITETDIRYTMQVFWPDDFNPNENYVEDSDESIRKEITKEEPIMKSLEDYTEEELDKLDSLELISLMREKLPSLEQSDDNEKALRKKLENKISVKRFIEKKLEKPKETDKSEIKKEEPKVELNQELSQQDKIKKIALELKLNPIQKEVFDILFPSVYFNDIEFAIEDYDAWKDMTVKEAKDTVKNAK